MKKYLYILCVLSTSIYGQKVKDIDGNLYSYNTISNNEYYTLIPDINFEQKLINLGYDEVLDGKVSTKRISVIQTLNISGLNITDLTGIEDFISLKELNCSNNKIKGIEIYNNSNLVTLDCSNNLLTSINLIDAPNLETLSCNDNLLTNVNFIDVPKLATVNCRNNKLKYIEPGKASGLINLDLNNNYLTSLDLRGLTISNLDIEKNYVLGCVSVDDLTYASENFQKKEPETIFMNNCFLQGKTYIAGSNFEKALEVLGLGDGAYNNYVPTYKIEAVTNLDLSTVAFEKEGLAGIEYFKMLENLKVKSVTSLDLTKNTKLKTLAINGIELENLDVSTCLDLLYLEIGDSRLTNLDLSKNINLTRVTLGDNLISELNLRDKIKLQKLVTKGKRLANLDFTGAEALVILKITGTQIQDIDFSTNKLLNEVELVNLTNLFKLDFANNPKLARLIVRYNQNLRVLNLKNGGNQNLTANNFWSNENINLNCISVDDVEWSTVRWYARDSYTSFANECDQYLGTDNQEIESSLNFNNPVENTLTLSSAYIGNYTITSLEGKTILNGKLNENNIKIDVSSLMQGIYFLSLETQNGIVSKKFIKN